jgi:hypothetical protein
MIVVVLITTDCSVGTPGTHERVPPVQINGQRTNDYQF